MEQKLEVHWWDGSVVGHLLQPGPIFFVYDENWIRRGHDLSPLMLPFVPEAYNGSKGTDGLPGLIADCLPDAWGRKLARKTFAEKKWGEPTTMSLLAWRGKGGLGSLHFVPALSESNNLTKLENIGVSALAKNALEIERGEAKKVIPQLARGGTPGGALPKSMVLHYPDRTLAVGEPDGIGQPCLIKFDPSSNNTKAPEEHLYAIMARTAGIRSVTTRLIPEDDTARSRRHLLVDRFDVIDRLNPAKRLHFHTASGTLHKDPGGMDYADLFRTVVRLGCDPEELRELTRRMIFNVLSSNHDDHGKNHAFAYNEEARTWSLSPAYDMTYSEGILERGTPIGGEVWPSMETMKDMCQQVGIFKEEFMENFEQVKNALDQWPELAADENLPADTIEEMENRFQTIQKRIKA